MEDWSTIKHFKKEEFTCKCKERCGKNNISFELVKLLDAAREAAGIPFNITSGSRCPVHNKRVGGSITSSHLDGLAVDILVRNGKERFIIMQALMPLIKRIGINEAAQFIHVDIDYKKPNPTVYNY